MKVFCFEALEYYCNFIYFVWAKNTPTPFWALGPNMIASPQGPGLMPPLGPFGQVNSISSHPPPPRVLTHPQSTVPREMETLLGIPVSRWLNKPLGISIPSTFAEVETISKATLT